MPEYFYDGEYYDEPNEIIEAYWGDIDGLSSPKYWPITVHPTKPEYLKVNHRTEAAHIAERLVEDYLYTHAKRKSRFHNFCTGEQILEWWLEDYYCDCDDWYDGPSDEAIKHIKVSEKIIQNAINWWLFWNAGLVRMFANCRRWRPERWCIGITVIEQAIEKAEAELRGIDVYVAPDYSKSEVWEYPQ